jgi:hypothetical protein
VVPYNTIHKYSATQVSYCEITESFDPIRPSPGGSKRVQMRHVQINTCNGNCTTWSLTVGEERRLSLFENRAYVAMSRDQNAGD